MKSKIKLDLNLFSTPDTTNLIYHNNFLSKSDPITISSGVDAVVSAVSGPTSGITGTSITINATVQNFGSGTMSASTLGIFLSTDVTITTGDTRLATVAITALTAGASNAVTKTIVLPTTLVAKQYYIGAIADYTNANKEINESNNALAGNQITVTKTSYVH